MPASPYQQQNPGVASTTSFDVSNPAYSQSRSSESQDLVKPSTLNKSLSTPAISRTPSVATNGDVGTSGFRAAEAYVRPSPINTVGSLDSYGFDLRNATFTMSLTCRTAPTEDVPTEIFLPDFHFPADSAKVEVTSGKWSISIDEADGGMGLVQRLRWWHGTGEQKLTVRGIRRKIGQAVPMEEDEGYLEQCQQSKCIVM